MLCMSIQSLILSGAVKLRQKQIKIICSIRYNENK